MSSIYTAARFSTYERVRAFNYDARAAGHTITHDWTRTDEFGADGHPLHVAVRGGSVTIPSRERLRQAITSEWEPSGPIAIRAGVNRRAAGQLLAALYRHTSGVIERRHNAEGGNWEYRRAER